ncbi:hypothetical protein [Aminobacter sp. BE322]|uniref:hypothetical protein n=1 Tax=unclassified Aminobacter TaxID=2644704 RepID=UPI003D1906BE
MKILLASAVAALAILAPVSQSAAETLGKATLLGQIVLPTGLKIGGVELTARSCANSRSPRLICRIPTRPAACATTWRSRP